MSAVASAYSTCALPLWVSLTLVARASTARACCREHCSAAAAADKRRRSQSALVGASTMAAEDPVGAGGGAPLLITFEHFPGRTLHVLAFQGVTNGADLRARLIAQDAALDFAYIDADAVGGETVIRSAGHKALMAEANGTLKAATLHAELVFSFGPTRNIGAALSGFGVGADTERLLVGVWDAGKAAAAAATAGGAVDGAAVASVLAGAAGPIDGAKQVALSDMFADMSAAKEARLRKLYKLADAEVEVSGVEDAVLGRMALRDVAR